MRKSASDLTTPIRRTCGKGHDLSIADNVIPKDGRQPECRICCRESNRRSFLRAPIRTTCQECGCEKKPDKMRLCPQCRWVRATRRAHENPRGKDLVRRLDEAVALESAPPWEREQARKQREAEEEEFRSRIRSVVTGGHAWE